MQENFYSPPFKFVDHRKIDVLRNLILPIFYSKIPSKNTPNLHITYFCPLQVDSKPFSLNGKPGEEKKREIIM